MFAMVLAIGILVDDAIVVVENVERIMARRGCRPARRPARRWARSPAPSSASPPVLVSVFVPMAFFGGSVGNIYRQFSLTMITSMLFSAFLALSPHAGAVRHAAQAGGARPSRPGRPVRLVQPRIQPHHAGHESRVVGVALRRVWIWLLVYVALVVACGALFVRMPSSFLPNEDQGYVIANIQLAPGCHRQPHARGGPPGRSFFLKQPEVAQMVGVIGFSFSGVGQNAALAFVTFKPWDERTGPQSSHRRWPDGPSAP
jgi:multidrug efflux pump